LRNGREGIDDDPRLGYIVASQTKENVKGGHIFPEKLSRIS